VYKLAFDNIHSIYCNLIVTKIFRNIVHKTQLVLHGSSIISYYLENVAFNENMIVNRININDHIIRFNLMFILS